MNELLEGPQGYDAQTSLLTELVRAQSRGWNYCGRLNPGKPAQRARQRAKEIRQALGWTPPFSRGRVGRGAA